MLPKTACSRTRTMATLLALGALVLLAASPSTAQARGEGAKILPPQSHPHGRSYGEWAAAWWQWALQTPATGHPLIDTTGEQCAVGQTGKVWFLGGTFGAGSPVTRSCTIPTGTALHFPLLNAFYGAFLNDPPDTRTEEFLRKAAQCSIPTDLAVSIDGVAVKNPLQYHEESPLFDVQLPEDNVFGLDETTVPKLLLSPSVDQGYYLFLAPLPPGEHTIEWSGSWTCGFGAFSEDVTYELTVAPGGKAN